MKQKQVKAAPKVAKQTKATKKAAPAAKVEEVEENEQEEEEVVTKKVVAKKAAPKKTAKVQKVVEVEEAPEEEEEEEDEEEEVEEQEEDDEQDEEAMEEEDADEEDAENDNDEEEDDAENENEEEKEEDDEEEDEDEEDAANEEPTIPSKVKSGEIPSTVPSSKIVHVVKLPKKCKQIDIVEVFAKYGAIDQIHMITTPGGTVANVAFKTIKGAKAALADRKVKVQGSIIVINPHKPKRDSKFKEIRERCVYVRYLKADTNEDDLKKHFEGCGKIENVKVVTKYNSTFGFVTFADKSSVDAALELHNSVFNGVNISVTKQSDSKMSKTYEENLTVMVKNKQNFENVDGAKLKAIFSKCGEIDCLDIVCKKNVLAFVCYKNELAAKKALKLNGKTEQGIELETELYDPYSKKTTIHVTNLPRDCTEEDLRKLFSKAGQIKNIFQKGGFAIIGFENSDGYCKSFLYNESMINNQVIFVEPHSIRKKSIIKAKTPKNFQRKGFKRPFENGNSVFKPKKAKTN
ncbi:DNA-binding protein modulo [Lucilia cuprina]|uniref:DNA-binding protein modulo n=1 Tax=Lucilia cuprina TaxID=7375 RepID=A0A0L0CGX9_LUCCU|nr:DNA-binding protein modulo [Lucilia cuprina]KNC31496.1 DNA-binding protein modulo [Lucilia cuprina]